MSKVSIPSKCAVIKQNGTQVDQLQNQLLKVKSNQSELSLILPVYVPGLTYHFVRKPQKMQNCMFLTMQ